VAGRTAHGHLLLPKKNTFAKICEKIQNPQAFGMHALMAIILLFLESFLLRMTVSRKKVQTGWLALGRVKDAKIINNNKIIIIIISIYLVFKPFWFNPIFFLSSTSFCGSSA
jgi:hypothetical protein